MCGPKPRALQHSLLCASETSEERAIIFTPLTEGDIVAQHQELCLKWVASRSQGGGRHVLGGSPLAHSRGPVSSVVFSQQQILLHGLNARSLFGSQHRKNSRGMENEAEKGRKPTQVGFLG